MSLEVCDELGHRLLGDLGASRELADLGSGVVEEPEDVAVRRADRRVPAFGETPVQFLVAEPVWLPQQEAEVDARVGSGRGFDIGVKTGYLRAMQAPCPRFPEVPNGLSDVARIDGDPDHLLDDYRRTSVSWMESAADHGLILHAGGRTSDGLLIVNLWPSRDGSESAAADPRRIAALQDVGLTPQQQRKEHHELERYVVFG